MVEKIQLEPDEVIISQVRKHWFVITMQMLSIVIVATLPLIAYVLIRTLVPLQLNISEYTSSSVAVYSVWLLISWMALFNVWTNYYLDVWTITSKRLIIADQRGFFSRNTASFRLERLQDIIVSVNGIIPTLLDFGELEIQTAGEERNFKATSLPSPGKLKGEILKATDAIIAGQTPQVKNDV